MKKILYLFVALVMLYTSCDCSIMYDKGGADDKMRKISRIVENRVQNVKNTVNLKHVSEECGKKSNYYDYINQRSEYNLLSDDYERQCYNQIADEVYNVSVNPDSNGYYAVGNIRIDGIELQAQNIQKSIYAFRNDNPQIFWLVNLFGYIYENGGTNIKLYSFLSGDKCNEKVEQINSVVSNVIGEIPSGLSEYQRELYLHDWLLNNCKYDNNALMHQNENWESFSICGPFLNNVSVCEGYSRAMQLLLSYAGIECRLVNGECRQNLHMWNLVCIDKNWYHLDSTFNDGNDFKVYDYFNLTDEQIKKDHTIDPIYRDAIAHSRLYTNKSSSVDRYNLDLPCCNCSDANYFVMEAICLSRFDKNSDRIAIDALYEKAKNRESSISFLIDNKLNYRDVVEKIISKPPYKMFYYIEEVNKMLDVNYGVDSQQLKYVEDELQRAITINLTYK